MADNTHNANQHDASYRPFILLCFLASFTVAISLTLMSLPANDHVDFTELLTFFAHCLASIYSAILALLISLYILMYRRWIRGNTIATVVRKLPGSQLKLVLHSVRDGIEDVIEKGHSSWYQILLFGIGSIACLVSDLVEKAVKLENEVLPIIKNVILLLCCALGILFLRLYNGVYLKSSSFFHYSIVIMLGAIASEWFSLVVSPFAELSYDAVDINMTCNTTDTSITLVYNVTDYDVNTFDLILDTIQSFLQPLFVEFLNISAICLLELWHTMTKDVNYCLEYQSDISGVESTNINHDNSVDESTRLLGRQDDGYQSFSSVDVLESLESASINSTTNSENATNTSYRKSGQLSRIIVIVISVCVFLIYVISQTVFLVYQDIPENKAVIEMVGKYITAAVVLPLIILVLLSLYKSNNRQTHRHLHKTQYFTSTDYLLLCTSCALFVYDILQLIATFGLLIVDKDTDILVSLGRINFWVFSIVQIWGQTEFIMLAQYACKTSQKIPKLTKLTLIYFMSVNLAMWLLNSASHKWVESGELRPSRHAEMIFMFGSHQAKVILLTFLPFWDIYSFHCALLAYNVLKQSE